MYEEAYEGQAEDIVKVASAMLEQEVELTEDDAIKRAHAYVSGLTEDVEGTDSQIKLAGLALAMDADQETTKEAGIAQALESQVLKGKLLGELLAGSKGKAALLESLAHDKAYAAAAAKLAPSRAHASMLTGAGTVPGASSKLRQALSEAAHKVKAPLSEKAVSRLTDVADDAAEAGADAYGAYKNAILKRLGVGAGAGMGALALTAGAGADEVKEAKAILGAARGAGKAVKALAKSKADQGAKALVAKAVKKPNGVLSKVLGKETAVAGRMQAAANSKFFSTEGANRAGKAVTNAKKRKMVRGLRDITAAEATAAAEKALKAKGKNLAIGGAAGATAVTAAKAVRKKDESKKASVQQLIMAALA